LTCRLPTKEERTKINRALDKWGAFESLKHRRLLIHEVDTKKMVCLVTPGIEYAMQTMEDPYSVGLAIGELKKQFFPSVAGADLFARYGRRRRSKYYIVVSEKAESLVLYGRDVMGESIVAASIALDENEMVIILNALFEAIAIGRTRFAGKSLFQKGRVTVSTIADAGFYLREEK
jgi:ribosome biogenesis protein Nip4